MLEISTITKLFSQCWMLAPFKQAEVEVGQTDAGGEREPLQQQGGGKRVGGRDPAPRQTCLRGVKGLNAPYIFRNGRGGKIPEWL